MTQDTIPTTAQAPTIQITEAPEAPSSEVAAEAQVEAPTKAVTWAADAEGGDAEVKKEESPVHNVGVGEFKKKKKKKKSKSKMSKGINKPSGFEEYYVDPPVTPEEHKEEQALYDSAKTFTERIQTAIQRYAARRKFDSTRKDLFDKYMSYGGIDAGPKMFGSGVDVDSGELNAAEIGAIKATHYLEEGHEQHSVVDFDGVLRSFLSTRYPITFIPETEDEIKNHVRVIRNFLNYLLHHDVCPEHADQINAARRTCDVAEKELWLVQQTNTLLPGDFNKACSIIFGGAHQDAYLGDNEWAKQCGAKPSMTCEHARKVFRGALAANGDDAMFDRYNSDVAADKAEVVRRFRTFMEITAVEHPGEDVRDMYRHPIVDGCKVVGRLGTRTWHCPAAPPEDLTEEEEEEILEHGRPVEEFEFWVEDDLLQKLVVGMKIEATVYELSFGVFYFDTVTALICSFYEFIYNEDMIGWREHQYLPPREKYAGDTLEAYVPDRVPMDDDDDDVVNGKLVEDGDELD